MTYYWSAPLLWVFSQSFPGSISKPYIFFSGLCFSALSYPSCFPKCPSFVDCWLTPPSATNSWLKWMLRLPSTIASLNLAFFCPLHPSSGHMWKAEFTPSSNRKNFASFPKWHKREMINELHVQVLNSEQGSPVGNQWFGCSSYSTPDPRVCMERDRSWWCSSCQIHICNQVWVLALMVIDSLFMVIQL